MLKLRVVTPFAVLAGSLICTGLIELSAPAPIALGAALLLLFVLPGAALLLALPADVRPPERAAQVMLGFGMSIVLSMLSFWAAAQVAGMGIINRWLMVET